MSNPSTTRPKTPQRGWLEGTLDVISGITTQRPSTPTPQIRSNGIFSAPNSPMARKDMTGAPSGSNNIPMITRLPSQDSLDRSIHNDSGHGQKSTAQIIRDLKQSNARLTARTAALEADFMNQLNHAQREYQLKQERLEETILKSEKLTSSLEHRLQVAETKAKEKEESLQRLREESAFQRHTISDLRTQLDWAQNKDSNAAWAQEKERLLRELALTKEEVRAEQEEKDQLRQQNMALRRGDAGGGATMAEALRQTQATLEQVRQEGQKQKQEHQKQVSYWKEQLDKVQQSTPFEYNTDKEEKQADDSLSLKQQLDETKRALEATRKELENVKEQAEHQEHYRQEEADDLRVLNDAQDEEIERLRKDLEETMKELEIREQELEERNQEIRVLQQDNGVVEESSIYLTKIQENLEEPKRSFETLEKEFTETKKAKEDEIRELSERVEELSQENEQLHEAKSSNNYDEMTKESMMAMRARNIALEEKNTSMEKSMEEMRAQLQTARQVSSDPIEEQERLESNYQAQLISKETELVKLKEQVSNAMNKAEGDFARVSELTEQVQALKEELEQANQKIKKLEGGQQSGGAYEEDLRKEVTSLRQTRKELRAKIETLEDENENMSGSLRNKLADRDTTISALVKSNVNLESELSSAKIELQLFRARLARTNDGSDGEEGVDVILSRNEEVVELRESLAAYKETESRMSQEVSRLEKELSDLKFKNMRLRRQQKTAAVSDASFDETASAGGSTTSSVAPFQIKERDEAIARLVKQTVNQDKELHSLRSQVERLSNELESKSHRSTQSNSPTEMEMEQLRQESEMFAGQVIELDEEIENLRLALEDRDAKVDKLMQDITKLQQELEELRQAEPADDSFEKEKDDKIASLMTELNDLKSRPMADGDALERMRTLEAEVDELREANAEQMAELRTLRRISRDAKSSADDIARANASTVEAQAKVEELRKVIDTLTQESESLKKELEDARATSAGESSAEESLKNLRQELDEKQREIFALQSRAYRPASPTPSFGPPDEIDEIEAENMKDELARLRHTMEIQSEDLENAKQTIRELERMLAEKTEDAMTQWEEEKDELVADIEDLTHQLEEARESLANLEKEKNLIDDFKLKLEQADEAREKSEKFIVDNYDRKISLLTLDKDATIDKLRKELVAAKEGSNADVGQFEAEIEMYQARLEELKQQATAEIEQRDSRIFALENTLDASKQLVSNMRTEMDHLQGSMVNAAAGRKEEIEDLQQELVDLTATTARQERELGALRMKLEEKHLAHEAEVAKLHETITKLEGEKASYEGHRNAHDLQMDLRVREVKERLEKLKWRNTSLQDENESLRQRLAKVEAHTKADYVEREKYEMLQSDMNKQKQEIINLQSQLEDARAVVVTPAPTLPPGSTEKKSKSAKRMGFLGRRKASADEPAGI